MRGLAGKRKRKAPRRARRARGLPTKIELQQKLNQRKLSKAFKAHEEQGWGYTLPKSPHH